MACARWLTWTRDTSLLTGRNGTDFTGRYPELRGMAHSLGSRRAILDGEVVAFDDQGRPSFERLQSRMHLASDSQVRRRMREVPVVYVAFDLLWLEGHSTLELPYRDRRRLLERWSWRGPAGAPLPTVRVTARRCCRPAVTRISRGSWPSAWTPPTNRDVAPRPGSR